MLSSTHTHARGHRARVARGLRVCSAALLMQAAAPPSLPDESRLFANPALRSLARFALRFRARHAHDKETRPCHGPSMNNSR
jgi:hypothetical protein